MARPSVHTNPTRTWSFSKTLFKAEGLENAGLSFSCETENILKKELSPRLARDFPAQTFFLKAQIQNDQ